MKIAFVTGTWRRPHILSLFLEGIELIKRSFPQHDFQSFVSNSEGLHVDLLLDHYGAGSIPVANNPLTVKMNASAQASREWKPDYVILVGDDDIIAPSLMAVYMKEFEKGTDYVYTLDWYFHHINTEDGLYWGGYTEDSNRNHACGAGRAISARVMNIIDWQPWVPNFKDNLLDTSMDKQMARCEPYTKKAIRIREHGAFAVDLKSSRNMTPFADWKNTTRIPLHGLMIQHLGESLTAKILACKE